MYQYQQVEFLFYYQNIFSKSSRILSYRFLTVLSVQMHIFLYIFHNLYLKSCGIILLLYSLHFYLHLIALYYMRESLAILNWFRCSLHSLSYHGFWSQFGATFFILTLPCNFWAVSKSTWPRSVTRPFNWSVVIVFLSISLNNHTFLEQEEQ